MLKSTRAKVSVILVSLLIVAIASAVATYFSTREHDRDHLATDVVNYQRQLAGDIALLTLANASRDEIEQPVEVFESNMGALRSGGDAVVHDGETVQIGAETDPAVHAILDQLPDYWLAFRDDAIEMAMLPPDRPERAADAAKLQANTSPLVTVLGRLGESYESHMERELNRLRLWQTIFLASTIPLFLYGMVMVRQRVLRLGDLGIDFRVNQADQSLDPLSQEVYSDEVAGLVESFERMRPVMDAAQQSLEDRVLRRRRRLMAAFEYSQQIVSQVDKNGILRQTLTNAQDLVSARSVALCLIESDGCLLELSAVRGEVEASIVTPEGISTSQPVQIRPIEPGAPMAELCADCYFAEACIDDNALPVPLQADAGQIGSLCVAREPEYPFEEDEVQALRLLANSAAIAISNYRLVDSSRFKERQEAISVERERLTAVLHDNLAQTLSYLYLQADRAIQMAASSQNDEVLDELTSMKSVTGEAYDNVREMLTNLGGDGTGEQGPALANIEVFLEDLRQRSGLDVSLISDEQAFARLTPTAQQQAYYIVRESLTNVLRHAQATAVTVQMQEQPDGLQLVIQDNGRGFDPDQPLEGTHLGLTIMEARARRCGGTLVVDSKPNEGTLISAFLPNKEFETIYAN
ncbi:MAG TPA: GAF domain-containing sensor histidine kinase [Anaerolineae bacterium]|jgi:signal transduction histidine kinase|nr:GAF domain-containing sensor histidine kinase [Anaerolineae bacterium]